MRPAGVDIVLANCLGPQHTMVLHSVWLSKDNRCTNTATIIHLISMCQHCHFGFFVLFPVFIVRLPSALVSIINLF